VSSVFLQSAFYPTDRWELSLDGVYTVSKGEYESVTLELPEETVPIGDYDFSQVHTYSRLDFDQFEIHGRGDYTFTSKASLYVGVSFFELLDQAPYVYGDQDGKVLFTQAGFRVKF
jgi:hypothetical protein